MQEHDLNIAIGNNPIWTVQVETKEWPSPETATPEIITGQLLGLTPSELLRLKIADIIVVIESHSYRLEYLSKDGTFELHWIHS